MRWIVAFVVASVGAFAIAQEGLFVNGYRVELSEPKAVAVGVEQVFWKKDGSAIAFYAKDADGTYLGVYDVGTGRAKEMLRFAEGTHVHFEEWLPNRPIYLILTSHAVGDQKRYEITSIDVRNLKALEIWSQQYAKDAEVGLDVNVSPSLDHALITVTDPEGRHPIVVTDGAANAVYSRDVARAWEQGMAFAGWSADGTAYFNAPAATAVQKAVNDDVVALTAIQTATIEFKINVGKEVLDNVPILTFLWRARPIAPETGTPVYELMPRNAVLRPILSRGPYEGPPVLPHVVWPVDESAVVRSNERIDGTGSIWLARLTGEEGNPYSKEGVLVSGSKGVSWMCEDGNWIAYEVAGALFVRRITYGGQPFSKALFGG